MEVRGEEGERGRGRGERKGEEEREGFGKMVVIDVRPKK